MKQIFKIKTFFGFYEDYSSSKEFEGNSNFEVECFINYADGFLYAIYEISYQKWDDKNEKWVVLPNPKQPKMEGVDNNE